MIDSKRILAATAVVTAITVVVKGLGFAEKLLLAYFFGTGIQVDAYLVAYSIPFSAFIVLQAVVEPAFLPTFLRTWQACPAEGWRLFRTVAILLLSGLGAATLAGIVAAEPLIALAAPGFAGQQQTLAIALTRLALPALLFLGVSTMTTAALHAQKRFIPPALGQASFRAGPLLLFFPLGGIQGLTLGVTLGAVGKLALELLGLRRDARRLLSSGGLALSSPPMRTVGRLAAPLLVALSLSLFVAPLVENAFASGTGVGGVSALAYARKIAETLTSILPQALGLVLLPFSAEMAARGHDEALAQTLKGAVRGLCLLFLPVTLVLAMLRRPFIQLLLERGAFTAASTDLTAGPLLFYAVALLPFALEVIVVQFFYARQDTRTPVVADVIAFALNVALIPLLMSALGLGGIALAAALAKAMKVLALLFLFGRQVPAFRVRSLVTFAGQMGLASLAVVGCLAAIAQWGPDLPAEAGFLSLLAYLAGTGGLAGGAFLLAGYLLRVDEFRRALGGVRRALD
jgi:putative peptidoglycan lipid II flippase